MAQRTLRIGGRQTGTGTAGLRTTSGCKCGKCATPTAQAAASKRALGLSEREAKDLMTVMSRENSPVAGKVIALVTRLFPKLRANAQAPRAKSMAEAIAERARPGRKVQPTNTSQAEAKPLFRRPGFSKPVSDAPARRASAPNTSMTAEIQNRGR